MLFWRKPEEEVIQAFLARQAQLGLTYSPVGATATLHPLLAVNPSVAFARLACVARNERSRRSQGERGARANGEKAPPSTSCQQAHSTFGRYVVDHTRIKLGEGEQVFVAGRTALQRWHQFRLGWMEATPEQTPIKEGEVVAVRARPLGPWWWLNACRIVYVVNDNGPTTRFGFAYGTLPGHAENGEERFLVEWNQQDGSVWYDILAFSRPRHVLARLGYPYVRRVQKRFGRESAGAMQRAVGATVDHLPCRSPQP